MTDMARVLANRHLQAKRDIRQRLIREFTATVPAMVVFALTGISAYAAFASFGIDWAKAAGASPGEAAVWPIAVTVTTAQALYCRVRFEPQWHETWARWLFEVVAAAGFILAMIGNGLHAGGHLHLYCGTCEQCAGFLPAVLPGHGSSLHPGVLEARTSETAGRG